MKKKWKPSNKINLVLTPILIITLSNLSFAYSKNCKPISKRKANYISRKFQQNPFEFIGSFLKIQTKPKVLDSTKTQNALMAASFDISNIYKSSLKNFKSKALSPVIFDWLRTQYFLSSEKNTIKKSLYLLGQKKDLLNQNEINSVLKGSHTVKNFNSRRCNKDEKKLLGCNVLYVLTAQNTPELTCQNQNHLKAFESKFYLSFSKKYGFKILDIKVSGKRIVLDSLKYLKDLNNRGFNSSALKSHLAVLSKEAGSFKLPKRQIPTKRFLVQTRKLDDPNRMPTSL